VVGRGPALLTNRSNEGSHDSEERNSARQKIGEEAEQVDASTAFRDYAQGDEEQSGKGSEIQKNDRDAECQGSGEVCDKPSPLKDAEEAHGACYREKPARQAPSREFLRGDAAQHVRKEREGDDDKAALEKASESKRVGSGIVACCPLAQNGHDAGEAREGHRHLCDNKQEVSVSHVPPNGLALTGWQKR